MRKQISNVEVRHPYLNEVPEELLRGFEAFKIDAEWQWVLVADGKVKAQMLCMNAHGILFILRLTALPDAPGGWAMILFRRVFREAKERGILGYATFLTDANSQERRLMTIVQRAGGCLLPASGAWAFGSVEVKY